MSEVDRLEARIHNLELLVTLLVSQLSDLHPPAYQEDLSVIEERWANASEPLGACSTVEFITDKEV